MNKEDIKDRNRLELALDHETRQLISFIAYNWDAAASRMEQIANEREQGLYDDDGTEAIRFAVWFAERCLYYQLKISGERSAKPLVTSASLSIPLTVIVLRGGTTLLRCVYS